MAFLTIVMLCLALYIALWTMVTQPTFAIGSRPSPPVDATRLEGHVRMLSETLVPRDAAHPQRMERAAAYIQQELEIAGAQVARQRFEADGNTYSNVVATLGTDTADCIVIGAHYDAAGPHPAADDNASGVAGLIELARLLQDAPLERRVLLVAYALEEPPFFRTPLMGSAVHAASLRKNGMSVCLMLSLEMIGYYTDKPGSQRFPVKILRWWYPDAGNFIAVVGRFGGGDSVRRIKRAMRSGSALPVYSINGPEAVPGIDFSDHRNYWSAGYPAAMITDTSFYRNDRYHTAADTADSLDYRRMAMVVQGVYTLVTAEAKTS